MILLPQRWRERPYGPRLRRLAGRLIVVGALTFGTYYLVASWDLFGEFGFRRSLGYPRVPSEEVMFWYALPGLEAGVLLGLLVGAFPRGFGRLLVVLTIAVWAQIALNVGIIAYLVARGALF